MANNITILVRGDTAANWESKNSLLRLREIGYDMTNRRFKVGDGTTTWKNLPYVKPDVVNDLTSGGTDKALSAEQGKVLNSKIPPVVDNLTSTSATSALSAAQGKALKALIDGKTAVTVVNDLTSGGITKALSAEQGKVLKTLIDGKTSVEVYDYQTQGGWSNNKTKAASISTAYYLDTQIKNVKFDLEDLQNIVQNIGSGDQAVTVVNNLTSTSITAALSAAQGKALNDKLNKYSTETWTFTLSTGSTVTKKVVLSS